MESAPGHATGEWSDTRICAAMSFMRMNLCREMSLDDIAGCVHLSTSRFKHLFRAVTGASPKRVLRRMQIELASELLDADGLLVKEIATEAGMPVAATFSRNFRAVRGVSPRAYRRGGDESIGAKTTYPEFLLIEDGPRLFSRWRTLVARGGPERPAGRRSLRNGLMGDKCVVYGAERRVG